MATNIEIKARISDPSQLEARLRTMGAGPPVVIRQEDTFFGNGRGRLKLRVFSSGTGELIAYARHDEPGPKRSQYEIAAVDDPERLKSVLAMSPGIRGVVRKTRTLYTIGTTRVHLDAVEGLGMFLELECVLGPGDTEAQGMATARRLLDELGIPAEALVPDAYIDLLTTRGTGGIPRPVSGGR